MAPLAGLGQFDPRALAIYRSLVLAGNDTGDAVSQDGLSHPWGDRDPHGVVGSRFPDGAASGVDQHHRRHLAVHFALGTRVLTGGPCRGLDLLDHWDNRLPLLNVGGTRDRRTIRGERTAGYRNVTRDR